MIKEKSTLKKKELIKDGLKRTGWFSLMIFTQTFAEIILIVSGAILGFEIATNQEELMKIQEFVGFIFLAIILRLLASECKKKSEGKKSMIFGKYP